jgi:fructokinase
MPTMIVVAGEALIDLLVRPDGHVSATPGGGPFNTARTIGRLGGEVAYLGCLSSDRFGTNLRAALVADGVDLTLVEDTDAPTTLAVADLDERGAATYRFHTAATAAPLLSASAVVAALASRPAAFHVGTLGLVLEPIASAIAAALPAAAPGTLVMLDPNCRPAVIPDGAAYLARLRGVVARADIVKESVDDLAYLGPGGAAGEAARALLERGPALVLVTDGGHPVLAVTADWTVEIPVPAVAVVDSVGAGDAFGGAFLARWVELGLGRRELADPDAVSDAVRLAVEVAAITCSRAGADPPRRAEAGWPSEPSRSAGPAGPPASR